MHPFRTITGYLYLLFKRVSMLCIAKRYIRHQKVPLSYFTECFSTGDINIPNNVLAVGWLGESKTWLVAHNSGNFPQDFAYRSLPLLVFLSRFILLYLGNQKPWLLLCYYDGWREYIPFSQQYRTVQPPSLNNHPHWLGKPGEVPILCAHRPWVGCYTAHVGDPSALLLPEAHYLSSGFYRDLFSTIDKNRRPWSQKKERVVFCGGGHGNTTSYFQPQEKQLNPRLYLAQYIKENNLPVDISINVYPKVSYQKQMQYKYILDIDGEVRTWDAWAWKLYSGSLVLSMDSPWRTFFTDYFLPWQHYVPIANDLSDFADKIQWCFENERACQKITTTAHQRIKQVYHPKNVAQDLWQALSAKWEQNHQTKDYL